MVLVGILWRKHRHWLRAIRPITLFLVKIASELPDGSRQLSCSCQLIFCAIVHRILKAMGDPSPWRVL